VPVEYDAGINRGLGVPASFYHLVFEAGSETALANKRADLPAKGLELPISSITDGLSRSIAKIPTACRSSIAPCFAILPKMTRPCRSVSRCGALRWKLNHTTSVERRSLRGTIGSRQAQALNHRAPARRVPCGASGPGKWFRTDRH
jgi:hypothetical protein